MKKKTKKAAKRVRRVKRVRDKKADIKWGRVLKEALEQEKDVDAHRVVQLIRELHYLVCVKHGDKKRKRTAPTN